MFKGFWNWLKGLFGFSTKIVEKPDAKPTPSKKEGTLKAPVDGTVPDKTATSVSTWMQMYMESAAEWENDPKLYVATLDTYGWNNAAEAMLTLDWGPIVKDFSDELLFDIYFNGTDLGLKDRPGTKKVVETAVANERAVRSGPARKTKMGMGADGKQKT